jgi:uncharacterized protein YgiB involved in biofilm formation
MTNLSPRRKRSIAAGLTAAGAVAMLSGCDGDADQPQFGPKTEVAAFQSVQQCVDSGDYDRATCTAAQQKAFNEDQKAAPRFDSKNLCEDQFGAAQCLQRSEGGQSFFTPLLTGFLIGQLLNNNSSRYQYGGLYRSNRDNGWYTPSGAYLSNGGVGGRNYRYEVGQKAITTPVTTQRIQTRSSVVSRGGFGGRVSARSSGGWGGGRSFGG